MGRTTEKKERYSSRSNVLIGYTDNRGNVRIARYHEHCKCGPMAAVIEKNVQSNRE